MAGQSEFTSLKIIAKPLPPGNVTVPVSSSCSICHDKQKPNEVDVLECEHAFHKHCIHNWQKSQGRCPLCVI